MKVDDAVVRVDKGQSAVTGSEPVSAYTKLRETLARSRELVAEAITMRARAYELVAEARRQTSDHRYQLIWALSIRELANERTSYSRLDDAVIRDIAKYRRP